MTQVQSSPIALYEGAVHSTRKYISNISQSQWGDWTPCTEWDLRQLVNHIVAGAERTAAILSGRAPEQKDDYLGNDPLATFDRATAAALAAARQPSAMEKMYPSRTGEQSGSTFLSVQVMEMLVHGWDVAVATYQNRKLDEHIVAACWATAEPNRARFRQGTAFGGPKEPEVGANATTQEKLLAVLGRNPWINLPGL